MTSNVYGTHFQLSVKSAEFGNSHEFSERIGNSDSCNFNEMDFVMEYFELYSAKNGFANSTRKKMWLYYVSENDRLEYLLTSVNEYLWLRSRHR